MLLDKNMLPRIKRQIPQMEDLLQAEQGYLDVILDTVSWLGDRMILLREEVMNIPNLKIKIRQITGWECDILEDAEHLTLTVRYYYDAETPILEQEERILMYVPAHLKVIHEFFQAYLGQAPLYVGVGVGNFVRYMGFPQEVNGTQAGTAAVPVQAGLYTHSKMIIYPEV